MLFADIDILDENLDLQTHRSVSYTHLDVYKRQAIIAQVDLDGHVGMCLDTCHVWDAGYDIVGDLDGVLDEFDRVIGLDRLHAIHLNDSQNARGSVSYTHLDVYKRQISSSSPCCWQPAPCSS